MAIIFAGIYTSVLLLFGPMWIDFLFPSAAGEYSHHYLAWISPAFIACACTLVLSGVLARQAEEVAAAYAPFIQLGVWAEQDGWVALHGRLGSDAVPAPR